jgi:hypothetical protein
VCGGEESPYHLALGVGIELAGVEPDVVAGSVRPDGVAVSLQGAMRLVTNSTPTMVPVTPAFRRSQIHGRSVFKASSGSASLAQVVRLAGGSPVMRKISDSSRLSTRS